MAKGILVHRADSIYEDLPETQYQFPSLYLSRAKQMEGDWIIYYEPRGGGGRLGYNAVARIKQIIEDPSAAKMYLAIIEPGSYVELDRFVPYRSETGYLESRLENDDGSLNQGHIRAAMRLISDRDFFRIISRGFPETPFKLPRVDEAEPRAGQWNVSDVASEFEHEFERRSVEQTLNRPIRDRVFRHKVLDAYDERCALTGLKLINGGGRAEVESAHIQPVSRGGPDSVRNGIALSGTVHWMFDRGLVSLSDDYEILVSRQVNNSDEVWRLMNHDRRGRLPEKPETRPHPYFLNWHRNNCFKD